MSRRLPSAVGQCCADLASHASYHLHLFDLTTVDPEAVILQTRICADLLALADLCTRTDHDPPRDQSQ